MSTTPTLPSYNKVASALKKIPGKHHPSQIHGLMCGYLCASHGKSNPRWQTALDFDQLTPKNQEILNDLYENSRKQMNDFSFEFILLLPDDKTELSLRAEGLGLWCQGFLTALQQSNIPVKNRSPSEMTETLNDLIEIAQVNYSEIVEDEEDETAYFELIEYVRLAVLMIFQDLQPTPIMTKGNNALH